ncbi:MAG: MFS transporter [Anaerolineales bacterium]|nr:MFS transporter [Anaerolineales bacterium]MDW8446263.1 MFS transporter [Anaerolineales bacterium]
METQRRTAFYLILMMGLVSAFGDIVYESARSISGPYLAFLGASAMVIGAVAGLGEFLGYGLRSVSGYLADRTRAYWIATFIGYGLILCIPFLALAGSWRVAALLFTLERIGKAIRSPARDTILSHATHRTGRGWGFAIHEFLDQIGAILGPLVLSLAFHVSGNYRSGFHWLWLPSVLVIVFLALARWKVPNPETLEAGALDNFVSPTHTSLPATFWHYAVFTFLSVAGFLSFPLLSLYWVKEGVVQPAWIPSLYAVAMGVDAVIALGVGKLYDRFGLNTLFAVPLFTLLVPISGFSTSPILIGVSILLWGTVMSIHETTMRAAVADIAQTPKRATGYGIFNTIYGAGWFVGGSLLGWLYQSAMSLLLWAVLILEVFAAAVFLVLIRRRGALS